MKGGNEGIQKNEDINKQNDEQVSEDKELENMNKGNKFMTLGNFVNVMKSCVEVIINLGIIYFLQLFCLNGLIVRICNLIDIGF